MRKILASLLFLVGFELAGFDAAAQTPPTPVYGLEVKSNGSLGLAPASTARLRFNGLSQLQLSIDQNTYQWVIAINTSPSPSTKNVVYYNGTTWVAQQLTQDDIGAAFNITLAANGFSTTQSCGATITNPQFTASYNQTPVTTTMQDNTDTQSVSPATTTAIGYGGAANTFAARSYTVTTVNGTRTWTLSSTNSGGVVDTASVTATYSPHVYFGMAVPATINSAFITGLSNSTVTSFSVPRTISYGAGGGTMKAYFAIPATYTAPTVFTDTVTGFGIPFSQVGTNVSVTNECGTGNNINYNVYATDELLNAAFSGRWT